MTDVTEALREGDIYRWSYRDPKTDMRQYGSYHCCSRIAIVRNGLLKDTYWGAYAGSDGRSFGQDDVHTLDLTFVANLSDLEIAAEYQADYYDDADIVDLNHSNSSRGNFYLRKGAVRSQDKILAVARQRLAEAESAERTAARRSEELRGIIMHIEDGEAITYIPSWRS